MFHPLIKLLATRPELLIRHAGAYAQLAAVQVGEALVEWRWRAIVASAALVALVIGVALAGGAILLLAVIPVQAMPAPWLLAAAPGTPLLLSGLLWWQLQRQPPSWSLDVMREQLAADAKVLADIPNE